jgi:hypothetical protein
MQETPDGWLADKSILVVAKGPSTSTTSTRTTLCQATGPFRTFPLAVRVSYKYNAVWAGQKADLSEAP